ncbi:hypothetical protein CXZ10_10270 [Pleomorphomonas diazotrophica]|uniref:HEAT repeat domain-containing protein n=1 Tax=Pleomorphomonas diazotrophica TaxID=1166257 RepID=A0A1I4VTI7_9HYPH|nr:hypothetical protein [Pleomorphomonas diazotrophica]PKR89296.1 hypothetical protein CXZ10_10270 [Pleomorphomonas diazotrophica]SFN04601.1 hypothetical protein SAMN05192571_11376 [Pleomorphomonas diazotrophica]
MISLKLSAPLIGVFSAGLLCLGLYGMSIESTPFLSTAGSSIDRLQAVAADPDVSNLSSKRALGVFEYDCRTLAFGLTTPPITAEDRPRLNEACYERARSLVEAAPGNARLWLTLAQFAATLPDKRDAVVHALERSRAYGPWQYSLAVDRVQMIETMPDISEALATVISGDIETLAASYKGRDALAQIYVATPGRRDQIAAAVEKRAPKEQRNFLSKVQRSMQ